jgi:hypothetical protein
MENVVILVQTRVEYPLNAMSKITIRFVYAHKDILEIRSRNVQEYVSFPFEIDIDHSNNL